MSEDLQPSAVATRSPSFARTAADAWLSISPELKELAADAAALPPAEGGPRLLADQQHRWQRGERVPAEIYLDLCIDWADEHLSESLVRAELRERLRQQESLAFDKLVERFPQYLISLQEERAEHQLWLEEQLLADKLASPSPAAALPDPLAGRATLERLLETPTRFEPDKAASFVAQLAKLAGTLHRRGMLPCGLEPGRIALAQEGTLSLAADAAELLASADTAADRLVPDPFRPPELAEGGLGEAGARSDVYSLGAVLYLLLAGRYPPAAGKHQADGPEGCCCDRLSAAGVPEDLERVCRRAMAADPADRYASADDLATELEVFRTQPDMLAHCLVPGLAALALFSGLALAGWLWNRGFFG